MLELPMAVLGDLWIVLLSIDMVRGLHGRLAVFSEMIWITFGIDFGLELLIAPDKLQYLKRHWPVAVSLAVPALRIVRFARVAHLARAAGTIRVGHSLAVLNRGLAALGATMRRRGFAYVSVLTLLVLFLGAAGIYNLENGVSDTQGIHDYGTAVWWTAMLMTTLGPTSWPVTPLGRILCFFLGFMRSRSSAMSQRRWRRSSSTVMLIGRMRPWPASGRSTPCTPAWMPYIG